MCEKKFDPTKPVQTRGGTPARIICTNRQDSVIPIVALVGYPLPIGEGVSYFYADGKAFSGDSDGDLVNVLEREVRYICFNTNTCLDGKHSQTIRGETENRYSYLRNFSTVKLTFEDGKLINSEVIR